MARERHVGATVNVLHVIELDSFGAWIPVHGEAYTLATVAAARCEELNQHPRFQYRVRKYTPSEDPSNAP